MEYEPLSVKIYRRLLDGETTVDLREAHATYKKSLHTVNKYRATETLEMDDTQRAKMTGLSWRVCHNLSIIKREHQKSRRLFK